MVMPTPREDQPAPSPRTAEEPLAFTRDELLSGALLTWLLFLALVAIGILGWALTISSGHDLGTALVGGVIYGAVVVLIGGAIAAFAIAFCVPLVWGLGRMLRRQGRVWIHLLVYTGLGIGAGALALWCSTALLEGFSAVAVVPAIAILLAVPLGWWWTAHRALQRDRGALSLKPARADLDAAADDASAF